MNWRRRSKRSQILNILNGRRRRSIEENGVAAVNQTDQDQEIDTDHPEEDHEAEEEVQTQRVIETGREVRNTRKKRRNTRSEREVETEILLFVYINVIVNQSTIVSIPLHF